MILTLALLTMAPAIDGASVLSQHAVDPVEVIAIVTLEQEPMSTPTPTPENAPGITVVPCEYEDTIPEAGTACYWDAQTRGNGLGRSFMAYSDGSVVYEDN